MRRTIQAVLLVLAGIGLAAATGPVPAVGPADMVLGPANAPVTVIEYGSLTCPHCALFDQDIFPQLQHDWIEPGKIRFVFRDMPRDQADLKAFQLAHCGGDQRFWSLVDLLFKDQPAWTRAANPTVALVQLGRLGGLPDAKARSCLADDALARASVASAKAGQAAGVTATPTFFANGRMISPFTYRDWTEALTEAGAQ